MGSIGTVVGKGGSGRENGRSGQCTDSSWPATRCSVGNEAGDGERVSGGGGGGATDFVGLIDVTAGDKNDNGCTGDDESAAQYATIAGRLASEGRGADQGRRPGNIELGKDFAERKAIVPLPPRQLAQRLASQSARASRDDIDRRRNGQLIAGGEDDRDADV